MQIGQTHISSDILVALIGFGGVVLAALLSRRSIKKHNFILFLTTERMFPYTKPMKVLMRPIEVLVWSEPDGNQRPLRFRIENKDGELTVVQVEQILSQTENNHAGNPMVIYDCQGQIGNKQRRFELKFEKKTCRWWLYKI